MIYALFSLVYFTKHIYFEVNLCCCIFIAEYNIPLCGYTTVCVLKYKSLCMHRLSFLFREYLRVELSGSCGRYIFNLRNCQNYGASVQENPATYGRIIGIKNYR